ncbi:hypothetical protein [Bythopirellula polymerisocia]|uniref:EF-hand domain-containing protein n=1 Tax=Bythopirellula polymerisocia TaxID=2528003 RepID=A0A5C6CSL4_9BACT|nr:hypothetical protein [Bythopirellula polymerisocia]TWU26076.1 hypothetical protein Pla144_32930 [Bythopirellula polymerisocia]
MKRLLFSIACRVSTASLAIACFTSIQVLQVYAVENANINVSGAGAVTIPAGQSTSDFNISGNGGTGDIPIRIGASSTDDASGGILIGSISENGRSANTTTAGSETLYASSSTSLDGSGGLNLITRRAGEDTPDTVFPGGARFDANLGAGYFPFSEGWLGGTVSSTAGSTFNSFNLNGLTSANISQNLYGNGDNVVTFPGVTDSRRQGILLANHASDTNQYTLATPTPSGDGFTITTKPNNTNGSAGTSNQSMSFVFIPRNTPGVTLGRVNGGNSALPPSTAFQSGSAVTIVRELEGQYRMSIAGQTPSSGTLLVTTHGGPTGEGTRASDNMITYQASGNDWVILSQDLAGLNGSGQDTNENEYYFDFAFLPFSGGATGPGAIPSVSSLTNFSKSRVFAWNANVAELSAGNNPGETLTTVPQKTSDVEVTPLGFNRGDNFYAVDGAFLAATDGVMLASVREGLRDNSLTGGFTEYGLASTTLLRDSWQVGTATSSASPGGSTEFNINHAVAFFGADSGFQMGSNQLVNMTTSELSFTLSGLDPESNGVLMVNPNTNEDNFLTVTPQGGSGTGWDVVLLDNSGEPEQTPASTTNDGFNYVYLPYDAQNLVAGVTQANGSLISSTNTAGFTLSKVGTGEYKLTIPGKNPNTGMLLLNSTAEGNGDNSVVYENDPDGFSFRILGIDHKTVDEIENQFLLTEPEDTGFSFAYIDFESPPVLQMINDADFDQDGDVDGKDFLTWQRGFGTGSTLAEGDANGNGSVGPEDLAIWKTQYGNTPLAGAATAVPEPSSAAVVLLLSTMIVSFRKPKVN